AGPSATAVTSKAAPWRRRIRDTISAWSISSSTKSTGTRSSLNTAVCPSTAGRREVAGEDPIQLQILDPRDEVRKPDRLGHETIRARPVALADFVFSIRGRQHDYRDCPEAPVRLDP